MINSKIIASFLIKLKIIDHCISFLSNQNNKDMQNNGLNKYIECSSQPS